MNSYANICVNWEGGLSFNHSYLLIFISSLHAILLNCGDFIFNMHILLFV